MTSFRHITHSYNLVLPLVKIASFANLAANLEQILLAESFSKQKEKVI